MIRAANLPDKSPGIRHGLMASQYIFNLSEFDPEATELDHAVKPSQNKNLTCFILISKISGVAVSHPVHCGETLLCQLIISEIPCCHSGSGHIEVTDGIGGKLPAVNIRYAVPYIEHGEACGDCSGFDQLLM